MASYRVTVVGDPWAEVSGHVVFPCRIEYARAGDWAAVRGATEALRVPLAEAREAMQSANPLQALGELVVGYAAADEAVVMDSRIAGAREGLPAWPVTLPFDLG